VVVVVQTIKPVRVLERVVVVVVVLEQHLEYLVRTLRQKAKL
jgi:hypothetical protein